MVTELEADLNAVERVTELLGVPQEPALEIPATKPPAYWPSDKSGIVVEDLVIRYAPKLPAVIKGISFELKAREKVGLVRLHVCALWGQDSSVSFSPGGAHWKWQELHGAQSPPDRRPVVGEDLVSGGSPGPAHSLTLAMQH